MTDDVAVSLSTIELELGRLGRTVVEQVMLPGVPAVAVHDALCRLGLEAPRELVSLYGWRNGTSTVGAVTLGDIHLFPGFYLLSLDDAVSSYQACVGDARWRDGWFPVFANGGGDFYVLDLDSTAAGAVRRFRFEETEHPVEFRSLGALLTTLAEAFERGVFFVDPGDYLEMDDLAFGDLAAQLNPTVTWWHR